MANFNHLTLQEEGSGTKPVPSSSKMISFEFANGHPSGPHVSSSADDDDDYVEYPLDNLADFPSNVEEEERVGLYYSSVPLSLSICLLLASQTIVYISCFIRF